MISKECDDAERWVSEETFKKTLAVYQVLPGPEAHEVCVYFERIRGGKLGGFVAGLGSCYLGSCSCLPSRSCTSRPGSTSASRSSSMA